MSGSGPTCFGLFDDPSAAESAAASIRGAVVTSASLTYPPRLMSAREIIAAVAAVLVAAYVVWRWRKLSLERRALGVVIVLALGVYASGVLVGRCPTRRR